MERPWDSGSHSPFLVTPPKELMALGPMAAHHYMAEDSQGTDI